MRLPPASTALRGTLRTTARFSPSRQLLKYSSNIQNVTQPKFWTALIPKPLRRQVDIPSNVEKFKSKKWNPATFYIIMFLLIGSMPVQMIALRNEFSAFSRRADSKIDLLREAIERVQKGEEVDVEALLGTGDPLQEKEWEEVIREIEKEGQLWDGLQQRKYKRDGHTYKNELPADVGLQTSSAAVADRESVRQKAKSNFPPGFY